MPPRERSIRSEALVIRHSDWGEADRMLTIFTRELGKVRAIAKGVRKPRSRKAGHLEPFTRVNLLLARGRDLYIITQAETIDAYLPLRDDLLALGNAIYVIELLDRFTYEEGENSALYRLVTGTLSRLVDAPDPLLIIRYFEIRMLDLLGFRPQLFRCVGCEEDIQPVNQYFSAEQGGVLCPNCGKAVPGARALDVETLKYLRHFQRSNYEQARLARPNNAVHTQMEILMEHYLKYLLERNLNTPAFVRRVRAQAAEGLHHRRGERQPDQTE
jgi:DNA repair protein RecO (recombination protein O)